MDKGQVTKTHILDQALKMATVEGVESLSIGRVAQKAGLSKSGTFAHFGSLEQLQLAVIEQAAQSFAEEVFLPALKLPKGLPRLEGIFTHWVHSQLRTNSQGGCLFVSASFEYDDRPGVVKDLVKKYQLRWRRELIKAIVHCQELGHFKKNMSAELMAFELFSLVLAVHHDVRLFGKSEASDYAQNIFKKILELYSVNSHAN